MFGSASNDYNTSSFLPTGSTTTTTTTTPGSATTSLTVPTNVFLNDNKRKQRRIRTTFTSLQLRELEKCFQQVKTIELFKIYLENN